MIQELLTAAPPAGSPRQYNKYTTLSSLHILHQGSVAPFPPPPSGERRGQEGIWGISQDFTTWSARWEHDKWADMRGGGGVASYSEFISIYSRETRWGGGQRYWAQSSGFPLVCEWDLNVNTDLIMVKNSLQINLLTWVYSSQSSVFLITELQILSAATTRGSRVVYCILFIQWTQ